MAQGSLTLLFLSIALVALFALAFVSSSSSSSARSLLSSRHAHHGRHASKRQAAADEAASSSVDEPSSSSSSSSSDSADGMSSTIQMNSDSLSRSIWTTSGSHESDAYAFEHDCSFIKHRELEATIRFVVCGGGAKKACPRDFPAPVYDDGLPGAINSDQGSGFPENGGFGLNVWAAVVNRAGRVCAVATSGPKFDSAWSYARIAAAVKASTANGFSTDKFAIASGNLHSEVAATSGQFRGLQDAVSVDAHTAFEGSVAHWGEPCTSDDDDHDPLCGKRIGGVSVAGGGLALYNKHGKKLGALGVAGDCPCTDHIIAWKVRFLLEFDYVSAGVGFATRNTKTGAGLQMAPADNLNLAASDFCTIGDQLINERFERRPADGEVEGPAKLLDSTVRAAFSHPACDLPSCQIIQNSQRAGVAGLPPFRTVRPADDDDDDDEPSSRRV